MARFTLGLLFAIRLLTPGAAGAHPLPTTVERVEPAPLSEATGEGAAPPPATSPPPADVPAMIADAAVRWGLDANQMLRVAWCESKYDPRAYNGRSGASGVFQFIPSTWRWASASVGLANASPFDPQANVEAAAWLMKTQGARHWQCR